MTCGPMSMFAVDQWQADSMFYNGICTEDGYCKPTVPGIKKPRGIIVERSSAFGFGIKTTGVDTAYQGKVDSDIRWSAKLKVPIINRPTHKLILGFRYTAEELRFEEREEQQDPNFYEALDRKSLRQVGTSLLGIKSFIGDNYISGRASFRLSGDFDHGTLEKYFRSSVSILYGKRKKNSTCGYGINYSYSFGRQLIFPVLAYNARFSPKWSTELLLPLRARLRYRIDDRSMIEIESNFSGASYNVDIAAFSENSLFLQRSDLLTKVTFEKELYDFLWMYATIGNRHNINYNLFERNSFIKRVDPMLESQLDNTFYYAVGVFIVPPKKWSNKP